jgi:hypothetical protein
MNFFQPWSELGNLAAILCEGQITPEEAARLEGLARSSPEARRYLLHYLQLHGELYWEHAVTLRDRPAADMELGAAAGLSSSADAGARRRGDHGGCHCRLAEPCRRQCWPNPQWVLLPMSPRPRVSPSALALAGRTGRCRAGGLSVGWLGLVADCPPLRTDRGGRTLLRARGPADEIGGRPVD